VDTSKKSPHDEAAVTNTPHTSKSLLLAPNSLALHSNLNTFSNTSANSNPNGVPSLQPTPPSSTAYSQVYPSPIYLNQQHVNYYSNYNNLNNQPIYHHHPMVLLPSALSTPEHPAMPEPPTTPSTVIHVDTGHVFHLQLGDETREIIGPARVRMFSSDGVQPVPIQLIKPTPGQLIQQVIDENGVTHLILSSQQQQQQQTASGDGPAANDSYNQNLPSNDLIQSAPNEVNIQKVPVSCLVIVRLFIIFLSSNLYCKY
jgi:hypothetical protein